MVHFSPVMALKEEVLWKNIISVKYKSRHNCMDKGSGKKFSTFDTTSYKSITTLTGSFGWFIIRRGPAQDVPFFYTTSNFSRLQSW